jgi:hypothetical protein
VDVESFVYAREYSVDVERALVFAVREVCNVGVEKFAVA